MVELKVELHPASFTVRNRNNASIRIHDDQLRRRQIEAQKLHNNQQSLL